MEAFGSIDFVQYWSAYQLLIIGVDPYDPQQTLAVQCGVGLHCQYPRITYTPPWLWLLMSPVLMLPFRTAVAVWSQVSVALVIASATLFAAAYRLRAGGTLLTVATLLLSFPLLIDLLFGQLSAVLMFGAACLFLGRLRHIAPLEGIGLVLLSAKPHLFVPLFVGVAIGDLRNRRWRVAVWTALLLLPLVVTAELLSPRAVVDWLTHLLSPRTDLSVKAATDWATDAPAAALARALSRGNVTPLRWPLLVAPLLGVLVAIVTSWRIRDQGSWKILFPLLLWLGFFLAPFAWFSDFATLALVQAAAVAQLYAVGARRYAVTVGVIGIACHLGAQRLESRDTLHFGLDEMFWFPAVSLILWVASHLILKTKFRSNGQLTAVLSTKERRRSS